MIKSFITGLVIGSGLVWTVVTGKELFLSAILAVTAWFGKISYEKWSGERRSLSRLQRISGANYDTLFRLKVGVELWSNSIKGKVLHHGLLEKLRIPGDEILDGLRDIKVLNQVVPICIHYQRMNLALDTLWHEYVEIREKIKSNQDSTDIDGYLNSLTETLDSLIPEIEEMMNTEKSLAASLRCAGRMNDKSIFYLLFRLSIRSCTSEEIGAELIGLEDELLKKQSTRHVRT